MCGLFLNVFNAMRITLEGGSDNKDNDWLLPMLSSMCIVEEARYRKIIGLEDIISSVDPYKDIAELKHNTFMAFVLCGAPNPLIAFTEHYNKITSDKDGFSAEFMLVTEALAMQEGWKSVLND